MREMPEWVHVWFWLRFLRKPQDMTPLPQQDDFNPEAMTLSRYEELHQEWLDKGAVRTSPKTIIAAMSGAATKADDIPF